MLRIDDSLDPVGLMPRITRLWNLSAAKIRAIEESFDSAKGSPVFTERGVYTARGWTEWTQGFEFGSALLQYDASGELEFLELGRDRTVACMAPHLTHSGVHDHGFNNVSTYGNLLRLMLEGKIESDRWQREFYHLALKCSAAVQARRWTSIRGGLGFIYSFNGPHSLFVDAIRSLRILALGYQLGHRMMDEGDKVVSLLERLAQHGLATARYSVFYGEGRDHYDRRGRVAHEIVFNPNDGSYRCPNTQQGYSPFSTWTRGLAWAICGFAEQLEFLRTLPDEELDLFGGCAEVRREFLRAARAAGDFFIENTTADGVPYWDTGAPGLRPEDLERPADPYHSREPVDSSAAAIAAQGLLRLGHYVGDESPEDARRYRQAGLTVLNTLLDEPYLSADPTHQGLILHSIYHRPNAWDHVPSERGVPCGESSMWGDYHAREAALYVQRIARGDPYLTFFLRTDSPRGMR